MRHHRFVRDSASVSRLCYGHAVTVALLVFGCLIESPGQAGARPHRYRQRHIEQKSEERAEAKKQPSGPLFAVVSLADQHVSFYDANGLFARGQVATGVPGHPTPTGVFTILEKERWHRSNIYSGAPMPFMQRVTWTGVALHEGVVPGGRPASHGCIRMHPDFARQMFYLTKEGQRVIIAPQDVMPVDIAHAHLPLPKLQTPSLETPAAGHSGVEPVALDTQAAPANTASAQPVNPGEFAKAMKAASAAKAAAAAQAKKAALALIEGKLAEARAAGRELERAEALARRAKDELEDAARNAEKAQGDEAVKAGERKAAAEAKSAAASKALDEARDAKEAKDRNLLAVQEAVREADRAQAEAAAQSKEAERRMEPISIFISRKTGILYVRQATVHLFETPIAIRDPARPIGTHLFIATRPGEDGASLRWVSLTPPAAAEYKQRPHSSRRGRKFEPEEDIAPAPAFPESAAGALDRIEIPEEALQRIAGLVWTGATLIVSDVGMSGEGKFAMDFMILGRTRIREE
jgi:hypothetical protein